MTPPVRLTFSSARTRICTPCRMTVQGATSPDRLARKAGACEVFQLGRHSPVPAPIMAETILKGILDAGYYMRRGWSSGSSERPAKFAL